MPDFRYPQSLPPLAPGPTITPRERRAVSSIDGLPALRSRQRDFAGATITWTAHYTLREMEEWVAWYEGTLAYGTRWFGCPLPGRGGLQMRVCKYLGPVLRTKRGPRVWQCSGLLELRGAALVPQQANVIDPNLLVLMHFDSDFSNSVPGGPSFALTQGSSADPPAIETLLGSGIAPRFGAGSARIYKVAGGNSQQTIYSDPPISVSLGGAVRYQIEGWARWSGERDTVDRTLFDITARALYLTERQLRLRCPGSQPAGQRGTLQLSAWFQGEAQLVSVLNVVMAKQMVVGQWMHYAVVGDEDGTRVYLDGDLIQADTRKLRTQAFGDQQIVIGSNRTNATLDLAGNGVVDTLGINQPSNFGGTWAGHLDEFRMLVGRRTITGTTYAVPTAPFDIYL